MKMENFKIVSRNTGATYFLNDKEREIFFGNINGVNQDYDVLKQNNSFYKDGKYQYDILNLTKAKARRKDKMLDALAYVCVIGASMLMTIMYIQNYC